MGLTEIILLILGIGVFVASFVLPEKKEKLSEQDRRLGEAQIKEMVDEQLREVKNRVSDVTDETITYAVEKTERSLERMTNEKIMAVNEYSDTVLEAIHKNHEEVMFLYDMLNDKHDKLKDTAVEVEKKAKETLQKVKDAEGISEPFAEEKLAVQEERKPAQIPDEQPPFVKLQAEFVSEPAINDKKDEEDTAVKEKPVKKTTKAKGKKQEPERSGSMPEMDLSFASVGEEGRNNNEKILELHKAGKSNVAIARELGLGIGEVKLVIDLFKGV